MNVNVVLALIFNGKSWEWRKRFSYIYLISKTTQFGWNTKNFTENLYCSTHMKNFDIINFKPALRKYISKKIKSLTQHWKSASCTVLSVLENAVQPEGINAISGNMEIVVINLIAIGGSYFAKLQNPCYSPQRYISRNINDHFHTVFISVRETEK